MTSKFVKIIRPGLARQHRDLVAVVLPRQIESGPTFGVGARGGLGGFGAFEAEDRPAVGRTHVIAIGLGHRMSRRVY